MEEEIECHVVSKMEPSDSDAETEDIKTTILKNMPIIITNDGNILGGSLQLIGNSDGNLQINTVEETIIQQINESEDIEHEEIEKDTEETTYIEEVLNENSSFMEDNIIGSNTIIENATITGEDSITVDNYTEIEDDMYVEDDDDDPDFEIEIPKRKVKSEKKDDDVNPCTICQRTFKTAPSLKRHVTVCHSIEEEQDDPLAFELCMCCGEPVDSAHMSGDFKCDQCDKLFAMQNSLERHRSIEHSEGGVWQCIECSQPFSERSQLIEHMQIHPINKTYSCRQCNREFTRKYHLDRHIAQTGCDGNPRNEFKCQVCQKVFSRKDNLRDHLRAHAGQVKKKKIFHCEYCNKEFRGSALLAVHLRTHTVVQ